MPEFLKNLDKEARVAAAWRITLITCVTLGACLGFFALLNFVDQHFFQWQEASVAPMVFGSVVLIGVAFIALVVWAYQRRPKPRELAAKVEEANPELMDTLNCAVDLSEKKGDDLNFLEERVMQEASVRADSASIARAVRPNAWIWLSVLLVLFAFLLISANTVDWGSYTVVKKTMAHLSGESALEVTSRLSAALDGADENDPDFEYVRGSEVSIFAKVLRPYPGEGEPSLEYYDDDGTLRSVPMRSTGEPDRYEFLAPPLVQTMKYRVSTASFTGEWYELDPYSAPAFRKVAWTVTPPSYVGLKETMHEGFETRKVPEGSLVALQVAVADLPPNVISEVIEEQKTEEGEQELTPIPKSPDGTRMLKRKLPEPWKGRIKLSDAEHPDRTAVVSDEFSFLVIRDEPPMVEITKPGKDLELPANANFEVEFFASDDYGVAAAEIVVSHGGEPTVTNAFVDPVEKEKELTHLFSLEDFSLAVGDVVSYHVKVADNKEPEAQETRSEIYFIMILPPLGDPMEGEGMEGEEQKEVPVRDFINRTKKIIRATYDALPEEGREREERAVAITSDAVDLKHEMTKVYDEFEGQFPEVDGIDTAELLNEATYFIEQTEIFAGDGELKESLEPSEQTLRKLVLLYALLRQNPMKGKGEGKGESESEENQAENEEKSEDGEEGKGEDPAEELKALGEALEKTRELKEKQQELNARIGRAARNGKKGEPNREMAKQQDDIEKELDEVRDDLYDRSGRLSDVESFDQAGGEMSKSEKELKADDPKAAKPHGARAVEALANAEKGLEARMLAAGVAMLENLENKGRQLAKSQEGNAADTEGAQPGQGEGLKGQQDKINEEVKNLLSEIEGAGLSLRELNENAIQDLYGAASEAREGGIESSGKRASNALLYEAFPRAKQEEDKVARELNETADKLGEVKRKLANQGNHALRELIEDLKESRAELPGMSDGEMREMAKEAANRLGGLPETESDQLLKNATGLLEQVAGENKPTQAKTAVQRELTNVIERLEEYFWKDAAEERLRRNHESIAAPRKYKRQVEEYFRRIAEDQ